MENNPNESIEVEMNTHIRCLSVVPVELEELLAEIDKESEEVTEGN